VLSVAKAAEHACVCESIIRSWIADGTLPHYRLGKKGTRGKIVIAVEDLDGVLANFRVEKRKPEPVKAPAPKPAPARSGFRHLRLT
jgi:hypothetical protein